MLSRHRNLALVAATSGLFASCQGAVDFQPVRQDIARQQEELVACRRASQAPGTFRNCTAKYGPELARLSQQAVDEAGRIANIPTRISFYAVAAQGGWESGIDPGFQTADAAIQAGTALCTSTATNTTAPPRDCAMLQVGPAFVAHMRTVALIYVVESKPLSSATAMEKRQINDASLNYVRRTFDFVESRRSQIQANASLDPSVVTFLDRQRAVFYCTALHLATINRRLGQTATAQRVSRDRDRFLTIEPSLRGETCSATA